MIGCFDIYASGTLGSQREVARDPLGPSLTRLPDPNRAKIWRALSHSDDLFARGAEPLRRHTQTTHDRVWFHDEVMSLRSQTAWSVRRYVLIAVSSRCTTSLPFQNLPRQGDGGRGDGLGGGSPLCAFSQKTIFGLFSDWRRYDLMQFRVLPLLPKVCVFIDVARSR